MQFTFIKLSAPGNSHQVPDIWCIYCLNLTIILDFHVHYWIIFVVSTLYVLHCNCHMLMVHAVFRVGILDFETDLLDTNWVYIRLMQIFGF